MSEDGMTEKTYSPDAIRFTKKQVIWLLRNFIQIKLGIWPASLPSGYTDPPIDRRTKHYKAWAENIISIVAYLEKKIEKVGRDGLLAVSFYTCDISIETLAKCLRVTEKDINIRLDNAIEIMTRKRKS
ncbi:hypothetical protein LCGC14_1016090 [marine sediment metagenome]|uniref:RNA polymerase sigma factor 70 region 4 type 2 domain-containing protein n=1 Tax=marine sediment metagenome TaxID=412755 RepID=A0A0F9MYT8_9ZZZZ